MDVSAANRMGLGPMCCACVLLRAAGGGIALSRRGGVRWAPPSRRNDLGEAGGKDLLSSVDADGVFAFDDLPDGTWTIEVGMECFATIHADVVIAPDMPAAKWELKLLEPAEITAKSQPANPPTGPLAVPDLRTAEAQKPGRAKGNGQEIPKPPEEDGQKSADGFLVQGSENNAATSAFATNPAFGNTRAGSKALYTGGFAAIMQNSVLDARPYSLAGAQFAKPSYNDFTGVAALQGLIKIPHVLERGPIFFASFQWTRNSNSQILPGLVPTQAEQSGNLAGLTNVMGQPVTIYNPATGTPYLDNQVPVCLQAAALLKLYPQPNIADNAGYNYQAPVLNDTHQDSLQSRLDKTLGRRDQLYGGFNFQSTRADNGNLFGFIDHTGTLGINGNIHWSHWLKPGMFVFTSYTFSRLRLR